MFYNAREIFETLYEQYRNARPWIKDSPFLKGQVAGFITALGMLANLEELQTDDKIHEIMKEVLEYDYNK